MERGFLPCAPLASTWNSFAPFIYMGFIVPTLASKGNTPGSSPPHTNTLLSSQQPGEVGCDEKQQLAQGHSVSFMGP